MRSIAFLLFAIVASAWAEIVVITVGGNTTGNAEAVFNPQSVNVTMGDTLFFNFTQGNHTATQSTFASPCIPAHDTNSSINSFDSGFRDTVNGTAITNLQVTIADNSTLWFFDYNTCAQGGVGGANINESSLQTLEGFERNAERLNGTESTSTSSSSPTGTSASTTPHATAVSGSKSRTPRAVIWGAASVIPALAVLAAISL